MEQAESPTSNLQRQTSSNNAFTLIEMLATVAALVIVLGLAVSLARYVRRQASGQLTKDLLSRLDELTRRDVDRYDTLPPEAELQKNAVDNNKAYVKAARVEARRRADEFGNLPPSFYDDKEGV